MSSTGSCPDEFLLCQLVPRVHVRAVIVHPVLRLFSHAAQRKQGRHRSMYFGSDERPERFSCLWSLPIV